MARKKSAKRPAKKGPTAKKKTTIKSIANKAAPDEGSPTSEAELAALFKVHEAEEKRKVAKEERKIDAPERDIRPRRKRRYALWAALILVIISAAGYVWLRQRLKQSLTPEEGALTVRGIGADVTISRDDYGVPHIKAETLADMAFGAGFATAADRNFQIEFLRRMAYGRLAEVVGKDALGVDIYMRTFGFEELAKKNLQILDAKQKAMLAAFASGVNAQRAAYPKKQLEFMVLRLEAEPWKSEDSLALYQLFSFLLATNHIEEIAFLKFAANLGLEKAAWLFPVYEDEAIPFSEALHLKGVDFKKFANGDRELKAAVDGADRLWQSLIGEPSLPASNNWIVAPDKTSSGKSLLANDTHLQLTVPAMWYMMNLECPEYRAAGVALPGTPIVALGSNGTIAWGATMVMADNQDIFLEQLREIPEGIGGSKTQYLYKNTWYDAQTTQETIKIRGGKTHAFKRMRTRHGVLLNEALRQAFPNPHLAISLKSDYGLAYRTSVGAGDTTMVGIFEMAAARNMTEARVALDKVTGIYLNAVYADEKNVGYLATGRYPARKGASGLFPRIGWSGDDDWDGYYAPSENPAVLNPKTGYLATANHRIWNNQDGCIDATVDPESVCKIGSDLWISSSWYGSDRADRARELLAGNKKLSLKDMAHFQGDQFSHTAKRVRDLLFADGFASELSQAIDHLPAAQNIKALEALNALRTFDGNLDKSSQAAAIYENFASAVAVLTFADELGGHGSQLWANFQAINKRSYNAVQDHLLGRADSPFWDNITTDEKETKATIFAAALAEAIRLCEKQMGTNRKDWSWGEIHRYYWRHEFTKKAGVLKRYLNRGPIAAGGDLHTLNQAGNLWGDSHDVWLIPAMRFLVDFSQDEPAQLIIHMGVSGNAESQHYDDMIPLFTEVKNLPLPLKPANVVKQYSRRFVLIKDAAAH